MIALTIEIHINRMEFAKKLLSRAIQECPWSKGGAMTRFRHASHIFANPRTSSIHS
jgi:hypothetical protein